MFKLFKNKMQIHMEKKSKYENEIKLLKSKQKAEYEDTVTFFKNKKAAYKNDVINQLDNLNAQIKMLKEFESEQLASYDKALAIKLQQIDNKFNAKIFSLENELKTLTNLVKKEEKDLQDLIEPLKAQTTPPKRVLLESVTYNLNPAGNASQSVSKPKTKPKAKKKPSAKKPTKRK